MSESTCLIIEDESIFADILTGIVSRIPNVKIIGVCDNTVDAVSRIEKDRPDFILLDINISGLEGPEILELTDHKPKTIIISSHPADIMENYDIEVVRYIQKPLMSTDPLVDAIHECMNS